ncbi:amino acid adenylation domain-containing protein [Lentzea albidocapillata subsp. violacea]|uniref:Amino acid adenylation domain-containing protein n=1 Tax=Lentzea albidocapillata subsp. violacea TaxID=128104 RepID=A0A1G8SHE1_9PSEU|nr:non-ribosomal peptide synthetase [Lentzea albidocapillata]SDJ28185.1 amino acid adenylation domain-containing protein [Lentzea albidocapillata subsp. violacea]
MSALSFGQQRLWFLDQLDGPGAAYNVPVALRLRGPLDIAALRAAVADVADRHEVLRTVIPVVDGTPGHLVVEDARPPFEVVDAAAPVVVADAGPPAEVADAGPPAEAAGAELPAALVAAASRPFDLATEIPLRTTLFRAGPDEHVLLVLLHHIAADGGSFGPLLRDLDTAYTARAAGTSPDWTPLEVQYGDFALWQREVLGAEDDPASLLAEQLAYWTDRLAGLPERISLPANGQGTGAGIVEVELPADLCARLADAARAAGCTPFVGLQAAVSAVLGLNGAGPDVVLGTPVSGRQDPALDDLVGFFGNTLALRTDLSGDPGFGELLRRARETAFDAYAHQDVPFERVVERLGVDRGSPAHPVYQVMLVLQEDPTPPRLGGLDVAVEPLDLAAAKLDLSVVFARRADGGMDCQLEYAADRLDRPFVAHLGDVLVRLLRIALSTPDVPLSRLGLPAAPAAPVRAETPAPVEEAPVRRAPRDERERILCGLFADVLGLESVGVHDGFFALGGHSLLATRLISRVRAALGLELGLRVFFRSPTVAGVAAALDQASGTAHPPLVARPRPETVPLSPAQQGLWFLAGVRGQDRAYTIPLTLHLTGRVDVPALATALRDVVTRHESLRTVFPAVDGQPRQHVLAEFGDVLTAHRCPAADLDRLVDEAARAPFDLAADLPLRATLLSTSDTESVLVLALHHIAGDGVSSGPLLRDLGTAYEARLAGRAPGWTPLPVQYADYTLWQRDLDLDGRVDYWKAALDGLPEELSLPYDRSRPADPTHAKDAVTAQVDAGTHATLTALARANQATLFMVVHAALAAALTRMGAGTDIVVGTPVAGRADEVLDDLVGFFVNSLVLRVDTGGGPAFTDLLARVRETDLAAYAAAEVPFDRLVKELNPPRVLARHPLFQVALSLTGGEDTGGPRLTGLDVRLADGAQGNAKFDLTLTVDEKPRAGGLDCTLEFSTDLFDPATARRLLTALTLVLTAVAADPGRAVDRLPVLDPADTALHKWNDTDAPFPDETAHALFAVRAAAHPEAIALITDDGSVGYRELDERSNRVARHLRDCGVRRGDVVGIALERGVDLVAAVLGVLKAGAAYTVLDPALPAERVREIRAEAGVAETVTAERMAAATGLSAAPVEVPGAPTDAACVMFTSGSTGRPKGILGSHRSIVASLLSQSFLDFGPQQVWLQCSPASWDAFVLELFGPLLSGAACVLHPGSRPEPAVVARLIPRHAVTTAYLSASLFNYLVDEHPEVFAGLHQVMTGGEAASTRHIGELLRRHPHVRLVNGYGPVENMIIGTSHVLAPADALGRSVPIGRSLVNKRTHVLDAALQPVPPGVVGEVYLSGLGLAEGYLGQSGLTAGRFLTSPFDGPGERMYRTGDLGRWRADGVLEYVGRTDDQVKIRGFRVEPGEVGAVLTRHPAVSQAAVVVREDRPGDKRLVAYLVPADGALDTAHIRAHAAAALPDYLVPGAFVVLDALPLTPNGKLDRRALPAPSAEAAAEQARPRTAREEILCGMYADLLDVDNVGVRDSFFDLGGHSLLAAKLIARVRATFGAELALADLFATPTVEGVAAAVDRAEGRPVRPPLVAGTRPRVLPLSPAQSRLWFLNRLENQGGGYAVPYALRLTGALDRVALEAALHDVVGRHEALRTVFPEIDGTPSQLVLDEWRPALDVVGHAGLDAAARQEFDLAVDAPIRTTLFVTGPDEHVLLLLLHHIAVDGASLGPLVRDLRTAYTARLAGAEPGWAPLPVQYADYTLWQRDLLDSLLAGQVEHWRGALAGLPDELALPADRPRPAVATHRGGTVPVEIGAALHARLLELAKNHRVTLFMVLQAALATLLTRVGAGTDIPIGTPVAGRADRALDDVVGFFVNTLVLRVDTTGDPSFTDLLARVRETDLRAFEHQDVPFERLVQELNPARSLARHPLFQVSLVLQNTGPADLSLPGLAVAEHEIGAESVKFDLGLGFAEAPGGGLDGSLAYAADLFDAGTAQSLADRFVRVLAAVAAEPGLRTREIDVLDPAERTLILEDWNDTAADVPATTLPALFAAQVARTPHAPAVEFDGTGLTYAELDDRATELARALHRAGAAPGRTVGVALPRSLDLIIALYAVHKTGAAYLPVDPGYPADRVAHMVADAAPVLVLTPASLAALPAAADDTPLPSATPDDAAYVIYTSGSTGRPKGVVVPHSGIVNRLLWMQDRYRLTRSDRVLQKTPSSFDVSVWEFFWPLITGAVLVVAKPEGHKDPAYLAGLIERAGVTVAHFVPSMLEVFTASVAPGRCPGLRQVVCSGEALPTPLAERFAAGFTAHLDNLYGPTEASVDVTWQRFRHDPTPSVPIGRPVWNTQVYVLDPALSPVPAGATGELYLSGTQLATGYLNRPATTGQRFVPNPHRPGERMYRTGDLVRWHSGGVLEYLGRTDDQVKIRGVRIELGEVAAAVSAHPSVAQAAAVVREDRPGDKRLVVYAVPAEPAGFDAASVREFAARSLPEAMVPAAVVALTKLPLSPSGKLDRRALPAPDFTRAPTRPPRDHRERVLCAVFADVLGLDSVGVDDDFFDLGGHSLLATRLVDRVHRALGVHTTIRAVFDAPTPAGLATRLDETGTDPLNVLLPLRSTGSRAPLFCVHPAAGIGWVYSGLLRHLDDRPVHALQSRALTEAWTGTLDEMVKDYLAEIRAIQPEGPYHLLGWSFGAQVAHAIATRLQAENAEVAFLALLDGYPGTPGPPSASDPTADLLASLGRTSLDDLVPVLGARAVAALPSVFAHNRHLSDTHTPAAAYRGDALFFLATEDRTDSSPHPDAWAPHITGTLHLHPVPATHGDMTHPIPMAEIGATIAGHLNR